jgi:hypothetical protein
MDYFTEESNAKFKKVIESIWILKNKILECNYNCLMESIVINSNIGQVMRWQVSEVLLEFVFISPLAPSWLISIMSFDLMHKHLIHPVAVYLAEARYFPNNFQ